MINNETWQRGRRRLQQPRPAGLLFLSLSSFFLSLGLSTLPRASRSRFLAHCLSPRYVEGSAKTKVWCGGGGGGGGAGGGRRGSHRDFLFASFVIPLISLPRPPQTAVAAFFRRFLLLLLLLSHASPRPAATPAVFQPLEQRFIFIAMFCLSPSLSSSRPLLIPDSHLSPQPQPPLLGLGFFLSVLLPRSFLFSFLLLLSFCAAPRVARGQ